jgi:hypothetical protein
MEGMQLDSKLHFCACHQYISRKKNSQFAYFSVRCHKKQGHTVKSGILVAMVAQPPVIDDKLERMSQDRVLPWTSYF